MRKLYHGKLLMFGEYLVLNQGAALALPEKRYSVKWERKDNPDLELIKYHEYLGDEDSLAEYLNISLLGKHLEAGWQLVSDVPRHKGLGSSASIVAAIYDRYKTLQDSEISMNDLQKIFAAMENYMHGTSSGFDPLPIYFNLPVLRKNNQSVLVNTSLTCLDSWTTELIDSGEIREDGEGINRFLDRLKQDKEFASNIDTLTKVNNKLVEAVIKNEKRIAENLLKIFSENQLHLFSDWIPESIRQEWANSQQEPNVVYKMLGAGGGGYFLKINFNS